MDLGWIEIEDFRYPFEGSPLCFVEGSCVLSRVVSYFAHVARFLFPLSLFIHFSYTRISRARASPTESGFKSGSVMYRSPTACLPDS